MTVNRGIQRIVRELPAILGGALGATISTQTGDPVLGSTVGQAFTGVGADFVERVLSPRQATRIEKVLELAAQEVRRQIDSGEPVPVDGVLGRSGADANEVVEGVLLAARDEYEERKLPYLANQLASIAMSTGLSVDTAHRMIRDAESLSWLELRILSMVARPEEFPLPALGEGGHPETWPEETVVNTFLRLTEAGYLSTSQTITGRYNLPSFDVTPAGKRITRRGHLLVVSMDLKAIPADEVREIHETIVRVWNRAKPDSAKGATGEVPSAELES